MTNVLSKPFLIQAALGAGLGLVAAIAWTVLSTDGEFDQFLIDLAGVSWGFSLINAAVAVVLLCRSVRPRPAFGIAAALLLPYPIWQYLAVLDSVDGQMARDVASLLIGAYLVSGIVILAVMYRATRNTSRRPA